MEIKTKEGKEFYHFDTEKWVDWGDFDIEKLVGLGDSGITSISSCWRRKIKFGCGHRVLLLFFFF